VERAEKTGPLRHAAKGPPRQIGTGRRELGTLGAPSLCATEKTNAHLCAGVRARRAEGIWDRSRFLSILSTKPSVFRYDWVAEKLKFRQNSARAVACL